MATVSKISTREKKIAIIICTIFLGMTIANILFIGHIFRRQRQLQSNSTVGENIDPENSTWGEAGMKNCLGISSVNLKAILLISFFSAISVLILIFLLWKYY